VQQLVLPDVQADLAVMKVTMVERCTTCHINVARKEYSNENIVAYLEEEAAKARSYKLPAQGSGKPTGASATMSKPGAAAMPDFWHLWALKVAPDVVKRNAGRINTITGVVGKTVSITYDGQPLSAFKYNPALNDARPGAAPSTAPTTAPAIDALAQNQILIELIHALYRLDKSSSADGKISVEITAPDPKSLDAPRDVAMRYAEELRKGFTAAAPKDELKLINDRYRFALADVVNPARKKQKLHTLDASPVLLAHPRLDLYVDADSKHPADNPEKISMGCTSCHDGSGQETDFVVAAHVARPIMVDSRTGVPVPTALIPEQSRPHADERASLASMLAVVAPEDSVTPKPVSSLHIHLNDEHGKPNNGKAHHAHGEPPPVDYVDPVTGKRGKAITQFAYWQKTYEPEAPRGFKLVYHEWDRPMLPPKYLEANCIRCHANAYDIKDEAPTIFAGRALFAETGCVNCHQMDSIPPESMPTHAVERGTDPRLVMANGRVKVGPSLINVTSKLSPEFINTWVWSPKAFRPSTRMPHFFMLENNSSDEELRRTRQETRAITEYLVQTAAPLEPKFPLSAAHKGSAEGGKLLFNSIGCQACHANLNDPQPEKRNNKPVTLGEKWIVLDLMKSGRLKAEMAARDGKDPDDKALRAEAEKLYDAMTYNERQTYVKENLEIEQGETEVRKYADGSPKPLFVNVGPELSGIGTKLTAGRDESAARQWLFDWLKDPRHYSDYTMMPSLRLSDQQAIDLTEYLLAQKRTSDRPDDPWQAGMPAVDNEKQQELTSLFLRSKYSARTALAKADDDAELTRNAVEALTRTTKTPEDRKKAVEEAKLRVEKLSKEQRRMVWLGKKLIGHYGCMSCHAINGAEELTSPCTNLSDWGQKTLDKLDFGYVDAHKIESLPETKPIMMVNGLAAEASKLAFEPIDFKTAKIAQPVHAGWPVLEHRRTSWLEQKLKNTRIFDRGRALLEPDPTEKDDVLVRTGKPYDKIKMPTFYLSDEQVHQLATFVISNRDRLISDRLFARTMNDQAKLIARGRELTHKFNCVSCHWIERNHPQVQQFFKAEDMLTKAPPPLRGEGNKVQHEWLFSFFRNVIDLRPLLYQHGGIRMPSFHASDDEWTAIIAYFNSISNHESAELKQKLNLVNKYITAEREKAKTLPPPDKPWPGDDWIMRPEFETQRAYFKEWALRTGNMKPIELDESRATAADLGKAYRQLLYKAQFTANLYDSPFPFVESGLPAQITEERYKLGEEFLHQMQCLTCHYLGDPQAPGAVKDPKAPNLSLTYERLQRRWVRNWMQEPPVIQPGTSMPAFFSGLPIYHIHGMTWSEAAGRPKEEIEYFNQRYGKTADEQSALVLDYLYAAGQRGVTSVQAPGDKLPKAPAPATQPATAPSTQPAEQSNAGAEKPASATPQAAPAPSGQPSITGKISFKGKAPEPPAIDMSAVKECASQHADPPPDETVVVNENGTLKNVIVYISSGIPEGQSFTPPTEPIKLDQKGCLYSPHVIAMMVGQRITISNSDPFLHNVHSLAVQNPAFNFGQPNVDRPGKAIDDVRVPERFKIKCDVHPWMGAHVQVFEHPFFAVTGDDGSFTIRGLPAGAYTLTAWHERFGEQKQEIAVQEGKPATLELSFSAP
jgi:cbb3-type cytochrome oxidase cytochrome c subunit